MKINPRQMQQAMKRMGIAQVEVPAKQVVIQCDGYDLVFENPEVSKVNMMGQESYQLNGEARRVEHKAEISNEDIQTVVDQTGVDEAHARAALEKSKGDIAEAILELQQ